MDIMTHLKRALPGVGFLSLGLVNWGARCIVDPRTETVNELAQWRGFGEAPSWLAANHLQVVARLYGVAKQVMLKVADWVGWIFQGRPYGGKAMALGVGLVVVSTACERWKSRQPNNRLSDSSESRTTDVSKLVETPPNRREINRLSPLPRLVYGEKVESKCIETPSTSPVEEDSSSSPLVRKSGLLIADSNVKH